MATLTIRLPDDKHERLKQLAQTRGISAEGATKHSECRLDKGNSPHTLTIIGLFLRK